MDRWDLRMEMKNVLRLGKHQHPSYLVTSYFFWSQHEKNFSRSLKVILVSRYTFMYTLY